ncbi:ShlB/FhaC/HecB family hemolysin secretion/activation protein [Polaromonas sp.]|uniref:ShlB/FhaC/HecB family hemolysin secretion/activation protein n=1 Tax=Polaromonas sp. TaxID=1869339 RepID=UPI003FA783EF
MSCLTGQALAQAAPQTSAAQEERRAQERDRVLREQQERTPDVRLPRPPEAESPRLPAAESPCFVIHQLRLQGVDGDKAAPVAQFAWALDAAAGPDHSDSPTGRCLGAQSVGLLIKRVQNAIIARGYVTTRVLAEPQDLKGGILSLTVIPGRIRAIRFSADSDARGNPWTAVPAKPGDILNLRDIEQALENFKRVPTAEADIQIEPANGADARPGQSDLVISYRQALPFRLSLFADDSGSKATGKYQGGMTLSYDNWWTLNDLFYVSLNRDLGGGLDGARGTYGNTVHYSVPLGYWLLGATASNNRYYQSVAGANQTYVYRGTSSNVEVKLSRLMYRDAARKTTVAIRAFKRASNNYIDDTEVEVQRRVVGGFEASVSHREFIGNATLDMNLAYKRGTGTFGSLPAPEEAFGEGTSRMRISTADATFNAPFKALSQNLRYTGVWRIQLNHTPLTPQDRFAIGGRYTVRGFDGESSLSAERGWLWRNELSLALGGSGQETYVALDHGQVGGPSSEFLVGKRLSGAVLGLRGSLKGLQYDIFVGKPIKKPDAFQTAKATAGFSLNYSF